MSYLLGGVKMVISSDGFRGVGQPLISFSPLQVLVCHYYDRIVSQILTHCLVVRRCIVIEIVAELDCDGFFYVRNTLPIANLFFLALELGDGVTGV